MYGARVGHLVGVPVVHELPGVRDAVHHAVRAQLALALVEAAADGVVPADAGVVGVHAGALRGRRRRRHQVLEHLSAEPGRGSKVAKR